MPNAGRVTIQVVEIPDLTLAHFHDGRQLILSPVMLHFNEMNWRVPQQVVLRAMNDEAYSVGESVRSTFVTHLDVTSHGMFYHNYTSDHLNVTVVDDDVPLPPMMLMLSKHFLRVKEGGGGSNGGDDGDAVSMYLTSKPAEGAVIVLEVYNPYPDRVLIHPPGPFFLDEYVVLVFFFLLFFFLFFLFSSYSLSLCCPCD